MKKYIFILIISMVMISCKKEISAPTQCYECDMGSGYVDSGCMTDEQYSKYQYTDQQGNVLPKKCRLNLYFLTMYSTFRR